MRRKVLLGNNANGEIIFGEVEIRNYNDDLEFSASFNTVVPFSIDDFNNNLKDDYVDSYIDCFDKIDLLEKYDCKPSELHGVLKNVVEYSDLVDCSLYSEEYIVNDEVYAFDSVSYGQHDILENEFDKITDFTDKDSVMYLYNMWKEKHLKKISIEEKEMIEKVLDKLETIDEEEYITNVIKNKFI